MIDRGAAQHPDSDRSPATLKSEPDERRLRVQSSLGASGRCGIRGGAAQCRREHPKLALRETQHRSDLLIHAGRRIHGQSDDRITPHPHRFHTEQIENSGFLDDRQRLSS